MQNLVPDLFYYCPFFPPDLLIIDYHYRQYSDFPMYEAYPAHVRLRIGYAAGIIRGTKTAIKAMTLLAARLEDANSYPHLRTIYLPLLDTLKNVGNPLEVHSAVDHLLLACQNRKIEVVHEEQSTGVRAETQFSKEFTRRQTKERIEREEGK